MARRHSKKRRVSQEQERIRQKTMEDMNVGLHPAVYEQSLSEMK